MSASQIESFPSRPNNLDLPHLYQKPSFDTLHNTLSYLTLAPASWDLSSQDEGENLSAADDGLPAYLTRIIASPLSWLSAPQREEIWELASKRLSERSGRSGMGNFEREFSIPILTRKEDYVGRDVENGKGKAMNGCKVRRTGEKKVDIRIYEPALMGDQLGHKTWLGSYVLAKQLHELLPKYFPYLLVRGNNDHVRILELGAGTGLTGIAAAALFPYNAEIWLTDLPEIVPNLIRNVKLNEHLLNALNVTIEPLDWSGFSKAGLLKIERYDVILAADSLYAPEHPGWLTDTMVVSLKANGKVFTVLPFREMERDYHQDLRREMERKGFIALEEGEIVGVEDWHGWRGREEVCCWWCVWGRRDSEGTEIEC